MTVTNGKIFIDSQQMERDCWEFAKKIYGQGHDFDIFTGITRGGAQISIYMQEVFALLSGKKKEFTTIHAQSYTGIGAAGEVRVENVDSLARRVTPGCRILIVDDIFDRGKTFKAVYNRVKTSLAEEEAVTIQMAALYYKPENNIVSIEPHFHYKTFGSSDWIVLPHELDELSREELEKKGFIWPEKDRKSVV
jgi:hypothetical protein